MMHVVSVSGGKDSAATYCKAIERGLQFRAVAADTGNEHPAVYEFVNTLHLKTGGPQVEWVKADFSRQIAGKRAFIEKHWGAYGVPADFVARALAVLHPTGNPFLDLCLWKSRFPSRKAQFCTQELKVTPIDQNVTRPLLVTGTTVISWQGVCATESEVRKHLPPFQRLDSHPDSPGPPLCVAPAAVCRKRRGSLCDFPAAWRGVQSALWVGPPSRRLLSVHQLFQGRTGAG